MCVGVVRVAPSADASRTARCTRTFSTSVKHLLSATRRTGSVPKPLQESDRFAKAGSPRKTAPVPHPTITAVLWDFEQPDQKVSNRSFYTKLISNHAAAPVLLQITHLQPNAAYRVEVHRTGYRANDAYSGYIEMGSPTNLTAEQVERLNGLTRDLPETDKIARSGSDGSLQLTVPMNSNDIVLVKLEHDTKSK